MAPPDGPVQRGRPGAPQTAGLSAAELVAVVRVHLDRVHDAVRRIGGRDGADAVEVVRASALALVDEVATRPLDAEQAAGEWFRLALARARDLAPPTGRPAPADGATVAARPVEGSVQVTDALAALSEDARTAVLLRDAYDLPSASVAAALGTDPDEALERVARARLAVRAAEDAPRRPEPRSGEHSDLATLCRLAEDRPVAPRDATARRHVLSCAACRAVVDTQTQAARLLSGVVVLGPADRARADVLTEVEERARQRLPRGPRATSQRVTAEAAEQPTGPFALLPAEQDAEQDAVPEEPRRLLSPLLVVLSVVLAVLAGLGAGLLLSSQEQPERLAGADGELPPGVRLISPQPAAPATLPSPPTVAEQRPRTSVVVVPPPPLPSPSPPPPPPPAPSPSPTPVPATLALSPAAGPAGTELTVTGTGFPPGAEVRVDYLDTAGQPTGSGAVVVADPAGSITAQVAAEDPAAQPGPHDVTATAGEVTARATFTAEG